MDTSDRRVVLPALALCLLSACTAEPDARDSAATLSILTLNLHTYQQLQTEGVEESELTDEQARQRVTDYAPIFDRIAAGMEGLNPDIVCLQEVGEWAGDAADDRPFGASQSNMAQQVLSRLPDHGYETTMDWSHIGFGAWREGSAILSRYPILISDSRFVSRAENSRQDFWKSRKIPKARVGLPGIGAVDIYSVHLGWWDDPDEPFAEQFNRLLAWIAEDPGDVIVLCGDFNAPSGGPAYRMMTADSGFADLYLLANSDGMFDATIAGDADGWEGSEDGQRIDYVLIKEDSAVRVMEARRVFADTDFGQVSDHLGVFVVLEFDP